MSNKEFFEIAVGAIISTFSFYIMIVLMIGFAPLPR